jgi:hypothetical protein
VDPGLNCGEIFARLIGFAAVPLFGSAGHRIAIGSTAMALPVLLR